MKKLGKLYTLGSFAYRYAVGVKGLLPAEPLDVEGFLYKAAALGYQRVLLCENLEYADYSNERIERLYRLAQSLGLEVDVGFRELRTLERHIEIAKILHSEQLRVVLVKSTEDLAPNPEELVSESIKILCKYLPDLQKNNMRIGIENNFELAIDELISIVDAVGSEYVGLIMDCTNCLGLLENPYNVLERMGKRVQSVHLKDYIVKKIEAGYRIEGKPLGHGWLNVPLFLKKISDVVPSAQITIEYGMRRKEGATLEETLALEQHFNEEDVKYLFSVDSHSSDFC